MVVIMSIKAQCSPTVDHKRLVVRHYRPDLCLYKSLKTGLEEGKTKSMEATSFSQQLGVDLLQLTYCCISLHQHICCSFTLVRRCH